jgi:hypothetical protein
MDTGKVKGLNLYEQYSMNMMKLNKTPPSEVNSPAGIILW